MGGAAARAGQDRHVNALTVLLRGIRPNQYYYSRSVQGRCHLCHNNPLLTLTCTLPDWFRVCAGVVHGCYQAHQCADVSGGGLCDV
jgi:hypothetical protein